jgi:hypothetical protein
MRLRTRAASVTAALVVASGALAGVAAPAGATANGDTQGCTPGYWKNHTTNWQEYAPTTSLSSMLASLQTVNGHLVFTNYAFPGSLASYGATSMRDALALKGGPGVDGAAQILLRAATAAYLNAAYDVVPGGQGLFYPYRRWQDTTINGVFYAGLQRSVTAALNSQDRSTMITLAGALDAANNLGCPLS